VAAQTASALVKDAVTKYANLTNLGCYVADLQQPMALASALGVELPATASISDEGQAATPEEARGQYMALQEQAEHVAACISMYVLPLPSLHYLVFPSCSESLQGERPPGKVAPGERAAPTQFCAFHSRVIEAAGKIGQAPGIM
jgi:hypothetical protein